MEAPSQVVLRNRTELPPGPVLLVNAARDGLASALAAEGRELRLSCQDFGDFSWHSAGGLPARFEADPRPHGDEIAIVLFLPREKERLGFCLHALADRIRPDGRLWLAGENRAGIKSASPYLERRFDAVSKLDSARHCVLYEARSPRSAAAFQLPDYALEWEPRSGDARLRLRSLPGVFAHGRLDPGTALLLEALRPLPLSGRVLDFACGGGVIGLTLLAANPRLRLTFLDSSALALESARMSLALNDADAELLPSDGLSEARGRFDWIVSNPPFHRGVDDDLDVAAEFIRRAGSFLTETGKIVLVFNRHLPYTRWVHGAFGNVEVLAENAQYRVLAAGHPRVR